MKTKLTILIALLFVLTTSAQTTYTVTLNWDIYPSQANINGFNFYEFFPTNGTYTQVASLATPGASTFTLGNVTGGTHTWVMTAYGSGGESPYSNQASASIPTIPGAPTGLRATVNSSGTMSATVQKHP